MKQIFICKYKGFDIKYKDGTFLGIKRKVRFRGITERGIKETVDEFIRAEEEKKRKLKEEAELKKLKRSFIRRITDKNRYSISNAEPD